MNFIIKNLLEISHLAPGDKLRVNDGNLEVEQWSVLQGLARKYWWSESRKRDVEVLQNIYDLAFKIVDGLCNNEKLNIIRRSGKITEHEYEFYKQFLNELESLQSALEKSLVGLKIYYETYSKSIQEVQLLIDQVELKLTKIKNKMSSLAEAESLLVKKNSNSSDHSFLSHPSSNIRISAPTTTVATTNSMSTPITNSSTSSSSITNPSSANKSIWRASTPDGTTTTTSSSTISSSSSSSTSGSTSSLPTTATTTTTLQEKKQIKSHNNTENFKEKDKDSKKTFAEVTKNNLSFMDISPFSTSPYISLGSSTSAPSSTSSSLTASKHFKSN